MSQLIHSHTAYCSSSVEKTAVFLEKRVGMGIPFGGIAPLYSYEGREGQEGREGSLILIFDAEWHKSIAWRDR
jgi:hypothetical protein